VSKQTRQRVTPPAAVIVADTWLAVLAVIVIGQTEPLLLWAAGGIVFAFIVMEIWRGNVLAANVATVMVVVAWVINMLYLLFGSELMPALLLQSWVIGVLVALASAVAWIGPAVLLFWPNSSRNWFDLDPRP
jgi:hypothetical protein